MFVFCEIYLYFVVSIVTIHIRRGESSARVLGWKKWFTNIEIGASKRGPCPLAEGGV